MFNFQLMPMILFGLNTQIYRDNIFVYSTNTPMDEVVKAYGPVIYIKDRKDVTSLYPKIMTDQLMTEKNFFLINIPAWNRYMYKAIAVHRDGLESVTHFDLAVVAMIQKYVTKKLSFSGSTEEYVNSGQPHNAESIASKINLPKAFSKDSLKERFEFEKKNYYQSLPVTTIMRRSKKIEVAATVAAEQRVLIHCVSQVDFWYDRDSAISVMKALLG